MGAVFHQESGEEAKHHQSESLDLEGGVEDAGVGMTGATGAEAEGVGSDGTYEGFFDGLEVIVVARAEHIPMFTVLGSLVYYVRVVSESLASRAQS